MYHIVHCSNCNKEGIFDVNLNITQWRDQCGCCHDLKTICEYKHSFCDVGCMMDWIETNHVQDMGMPCFACVSCLDEFSQEVKSTGWCAAHESNGPCNVCKGEKRLNRSLHTERETRYPSDDIKMTFGDVRSGVANLGLIGKP